MKLIIKDENNFLGNFLYTKMFVEEGISYYDCFSSIIKNNKSYREIDTQFCIKREEAYYVYSTTFNGWINIK